MPIALLLVSNVFMTFAWFGHLKFTERPLWLVVIASWAIALMEYCFAVPANRIGHAVYSAAKLKTMQEVITLLALCLLGPVSPRGADLKPCRGVCLHRPWRILRVQGTALISRPPIQTQHASEPTCSFSIFVLR